MSIKSIFAKVKDWCLENERELVLMSAFLLISAISFGLGILWQDSKAVKVPIIVNKAKTAFADNNTNVPARTTDIVQSGRRIDANATNNTNSSNIVANILYVASKNGKYYHLPGCAGAKAIKPENKIEFKTKEEAEKAGYKPAGNCPGLTH